MSGISTETVQGEIAKVDEELVALLVKRAELTAESENSGGGSSESKVDAFSRVIGLAPANRRDLVYNVYERIFAENCGFIEAVARAVVIEDGKVLLCKSKGGDKYYLPGGHIDFGETSRQAIKREIFEETSCSSEIGDFLGIVESSFDQDGKRHQEINLVYRAEIADKENFRVTEPWIEYEWVRLDDLCKITLLPVEIARYCR